MNPAWAAYCEAKAKAFEAEERAETLCPLVDDAQRDVAIAHCRRMAERYRLMGADDPAYYLVDGKLERPQ